MITTQHTQELISQAYIHAIAGIAGVNFHSTRVYDYGVDGTLHPVKVINSRRIESGFPVDFQLKSSTSWEDNGTHITYDLEAKTYNDLVCRDSRAIPLILILLCLPKDHKDWVCWDEECIVMKKMCYWAVLDGEPTENKSSKRISIPKHQLFTPDTLKEILALVKSGGLYEK
jgi:hypothetical protein